MDRTQLRLSGGTNLAYVTAGAPSSPALLLLHGFPSSSSTFRTVIPALAEISYVIAPDLPGHGASEPLATPRWAAYGDAILELLAHLRVGPRSVYLHDFGAPVGLHVAMRQPDLLRGFIIQNANAHRSGFGPNWKDTLAFWNHPDSTTEAAATKHLSLEGVRGNYTLEVPEDIVARMMPDEWEKDWRVLQQPGRREMQIALLLDYGRYAARFAEIAAFLRERQPPAVMLWGRHDAFFDLAETVSWMQDLPRMEAHILDGGHMLLETHARPAVDIMRRFIASLGQRSASGPVDRSMK